MSEQRRAKVIQAPLVESGEQTMLHYQPLDEQELVTIVNTAAAANQILLTGKPGRVPPAAGTNDVVYLDLANFNKVIEHQPADQVIKVGTGMLVEQLNQMLAKHKQWWPVQVPADWTVLDAINRGQGGVYDYRYGGPRNLVLGSTVMLATGSSIACGGRVVKNVTGYDMNKLFIGSRGWLGVVTSAFLRLYALPERSTTLCWGFNIVDRLMDAAYKLGKSGLPFTCLELISGQTGAGRARYVLVAQIKELAKVTDEITELANQVLGSEAEVLSAAQEKNLFEHLKQQFLGCTEEESLEINAAPQLMGKLLVKFADRVVFRCCLQKGTLSFRTDNKDELVIAIRRFAQDHQEMLTIAYADDRYNYRVAYLPSDDQARAHVKHRLKQQLDPKGILNPFVSI